MPWLWKAINRNKVQRSMREAACESLDAKTARNQSSLGQTSKSQLHGKFRNEWVLLRPVNCSLKKKTSARKSLYENRHKIINKTPENKVHLYIASGSERSIPGVQGWFNRTKSINLKYYILKLKEKTYDHLNR